MKRSSRISRRIASPLCAAVVLLVPAVTSASLANADEGSGPLGVTSVVGVSSRSVRVGALFPAAQASSLAGNHHCTASVVHSPNRNLIVTAAHCLDGDGEFVFVPGYRDGKAPYGVWTVKRRFLPDGWKQGQDEDSDVAFGIISYQDGRGIEDLVGGNRFASGTTTGATAVTITGYPSSDEEPVSCTNKPIAHSRTQQRIDCPSLSNGTSGSPWVNGDGQVVGVLGGHEQGGDTDDISYSVVLGSEAAELYRDAAADP